MRIVIPEIPPSLNRFAGRGNTWEYRREKERWTAMVAMFGERPPKALERAEVKITYYFPTRSRRDPDNYSGKMILDGLTARGIIEDDSFKHIRLILCADYDKNRPRTEIEVTELGE